MNDFTPLVRPLQSQITIDSVSKDCLYDGFNYPTFRQLAKNVRLPLSNPLNPTVATPYYRLFSISNLNGWFAAIKATSFGSGSELIFSPLDDLRSACEAAKPNVESLYTPKRSLSIPTKANIVAFACGDTKLLVGLEDGSVVVYDTSALLIPGNNDVQPLGRVQLQSSPLRQVLPNPGSEQNLSEVFAVVGDGKVYLFNMQLQPQGGWQGSDLMTQPIVVDWSPKGKHIAIGLQTGDILTFSLTNKSTPHKHFPPTFNSLLVSLNWLGPGHTFRTSYEAVDGTAVQHIVTLDAKSSIATYFAPDHPFLCADRKDQAAYVLSFPKWDADSAASDENKSLVIVADFASIDLEILGNIGTQWYRQLQESPLGLPLDMEMNDTMILGFQADLTDPRYDSPIMYAYLNDGTLQGWYIEHTKPYVGMMNGKSLGGTSNAGSQMATDEKPKDGSMGVSAFGQASAPVSAFGQSSFGQQTASPFGGQTTSAFGQTGFGQQSSTTSSPFAQAASSTPAFGQSSFGQPSAFGGFGQSNNTTSAFKAPTSGGFGSFANASGSFGSSAFGSGSTTNAFSGLGSGGNTSVFGQGSFGSPVNTSSGPTPASQSEMIREASMSDSTSGFGGMSLGGAHPSDSNAANSMFGNFSTTPSSTSTPTSTSAFGGSIVKPSSGAFGSFQTSSAFGATKLPETVSAFAPITQAQSTASPAFGQTGFGQPSFGQSSFGKTSFGVAPSSGAFGAQQQKPAATSGGFSAFASAPTSFGSALGSTTNNAPAKPSTEGGFSAFASNAPTAFGSTGNESASKPSGGGFSAFASNASSAFGSTAASSNQTSNTGGGFGSFASTTTPVFGAADSNKTPAFGNTTKESSSGSQTAFGSAPAAESKPRTSVFGTPTTTPPGTSAVKSSFGNIRDESQSGSPQDASENSPPSSPEPKPAASQFTKAASPFGQSTTPAPSSGGAFANLQVSPSPFSTLKPASGFGAFGSGGTPQNSVFFKKPDETPPPVSAFSAIPTTPKTPTASASTPTFGSPSTLGAAKSAFGSTTPTNQTPTKTPTSGGFSAFSGSSSGFSAFAGPKTSFADLLKTGGEESTDPVKPTSSVFSKPEVEAESSKPRASVFGTPISAFLPIAKTDESKTTDSVASTSTTPNKPAVVSAFPPISKSGSEQKSETPIAESKADDKKQQASVQEEPSYGSLSVSSTSSSFVEVGGPSEEREEGEVDEETGEEAENSDSNSFLSEDFEESGYQDGDSANEESDGEEAPEERNTPSPELPVPITRSPSATPTPQPEVPTIEVSSSADNETEESSFPSPKVAPAREPSTTPPSTPVKEQKSMFGQGSSLSTPPSSSPFGLGLGRPSTRPVRSSPLANAVSADDEEEEKPESPPAKALPTPVSPRPVYGVLPTDDRAAGKKREEPINESPTTSNKRPKTPPLLSTMGPPASVPLPKTPVLAPATIAETPLAGSAATPSKPGPFSFGLGTSAATASAPNLSGPGKPGTTTPSKPDVQRAQTAPPAPTAAASPFGAPTTPGTSTTGLFGGPPPAMKSPPTPSVSMPPFTLGNASTPTPLFQPGASTLFGSKSPPDTPSAPSLFGGASFPPSTASPFGAKQPATPGKAPTLATSPFAFGSKPKTAPATPPKAAPSPPKPSPTAAMEEGMQKECVNLVVMLNEELGKLSELASLASQEAAMAGKAFGGSRNRKDLGDPAKWGLGDLNQFGKLMLQYEAELTEREDHRRKQREMIRELHSSLLKCGTRKEEIARFQKARTDKEFAKMLKSRTLGPELTESQTRLRKDIRAIRDRVQKLESRLQESKKKLAQAATCKPTVKAPSLDTINRTYRNIELAIGVQADEVSRLASRISKITLNPSSRASTPSSTRDSRLPDNDKRRESTKYRQNINISPNVAAATAAALNAERSASRLKKALLAVREEPLLNTKAAVAPSAPVSFQTPNKKNNLGAGGETGIGGFTFRPPVSGSLFADVPVPVPAMGVPSTTTTTIATATVDDPSPSPSSSSMPMPMPMSIPDWNLPEDKFNPTETPIATGRRGATGQRKHLSVPLKRSPGSVPPPPPSDFNWGPLPSFSSAQTGNRIPASFVSFSTPTKK